MERLQSQLRQLSTQERAPLIVKVYNQLATPSQIHRVLLRVDETDAATTLASLRDAIHDVLRALPPKEEGDWKLFWIGTLSLSNKSFSFVSVTSC